MTIKIVCPSGFAGEARRWKGKEVTKLADELDADEDIPDGGMSFLLSGPWEQTIETGPYSFVKEGDTKPAWRRVLKGDVLGALYQMRIGSFRDGDTYDFDFQCDKCKKKTPWTLKLSTILAREQKLPDASRQALIDGVDLIGKLFDGTPVTFKLGTIDLEAAMNKYRAQLIRQKKRVSKQQGIVDAVAAQTVTIDGKRLDIRERYSWASDLELDDLIDLADQFSEADCGYDTEVEVRCEHCRWVMEIDLPLGRSFLVPARGRRKRKRLGIEDQGIEQLETTTTAATDASPDQPITA